MKNILIITVNYKNTSPTHALVKSLEKCQKFENILLMIVDNLSSDESFSSLKEIQKLSKLDIELVESEYNRYYWGGAAFALEKVPINLDPIYDWVIICNNDIGFHDPGLFNALLNIDPNETGIIAPKINSNPNGGDLNPFLVSPISWIQDIYYRLYYSNSFTAKTVHKLGRLINKIIQKKPANSGQKIENIYAPHGACMIFSIEFFKKGGYLETGFTLYGEEISTAEIAKQIGTPIRYNPSLAVTHNEHQSTGESSWKTNYIHSKETYYYLRKKFRS